MKLLLLPFLLAATFSSAIMQRAGTDMTLESAGDHFEMTDTLYNANESFVFTAVANFESGQACGIAFGSQANDHYWVFNVDRVENRTKLLYFRGTEGSFSEVREFRNERLIGNEGTTQSELNVVNPQLAANARFHLTLVVTVEDEHTYAEFFVDDIKRFGVDNHIDLNDLATGYSYQGGYVGFNVFNSKTRFTNLTFGHSDYTYYSELYRNQYHYSQFSHWNNDPNGLVYYKGYYHMYYQTNPFDKQWGGMYWGHARSTDLVHWENLPIALLPDDGTMFVGTGTGWAWSGIAMVYRAGMSSFIDGEGWFPEGEGLLGYYTRDGDRQDQVIITSTDEGMTWTKRRHIPQGLCLDGRKADCRDPSIFPMQTNDQGHVTLWGMTLSGGAENKIWFLKSEDMVTWSYAGGFDYIYPECVSVVKLPVSETEYHYALCVSSRHYAIGDFVYNQANGQIEFHLLDGTNIASLGNSAFVKQDQGEDSYAGQCFYIDDPTSDYYGKSVMVSWFSGLPSDAESGIYANVRDPWNGGGMTIPVELGFEMRDNDVAVMTQKPITIDNDDFDKQNLVNLADLAYSNDSEPLSSVNTHIFEMSATIDNPNEEDVEFRVATSIDEYTAFGWRKDVGYYVNRAHTSDAGIHFSKHYHHEFFTGPISGTTLTFYALCDNGGLEVFCDDFRYAFYNLILPAPHSIGAELVVTGEVTISSLKLDSIGSIWYDESSLEEGYLSLDSDYIDLDLTLCKEKEIICYSSNHEEISFDITSGEDVISLEPTLKGCKVTALQVGVALVDVITASDTKTFTVNVENGEVDTFFDIDDASVHSGTWRAISSGLEGSSSGDGFLLSDVVSGDATITATIDLTNARAAGILFRASADMSSYIMTNVDKGENVCKIWSPLGLIGSAPVSIPNPSNIVLSVHIMGRSVEISLNGASVINGRIHDGDPLGGTIGLNVFSGKALFTKVELLKEDYDFEGEDVVVISPVEQSIKAIYNMNQKNRLVTANYYSIEGTSLKIAKEYLSQLDENTTYFFYIEGSLASFTIRINTKSIERSYSFDPVTIQEGVDLTVFAKGLDVTKVTVGGTEVPFTKENGAVRVAAEHFAVGRNMVVLNDTYSFLVMVNANEEETVPEESSSPSTPTPSTPTKPDKQSVSYLPIIIGASIGGVVLLAAIAGIIVGVTLHSKKKKGAKK